MDELYKATVEVLEDIRIKNLYDDTRQIWKIAMSTQRQISKVVKW